VTELAERLHGPACSCARCVGFQKANTLSLKHGASSERQIRPVAGNHRRLVLRQIGLRASEIDPTGKAYLEHYCRLTAKFVLIDSYLDELGPLDADGAPRPCMRLYAELHRAALQALGRLEHLSTVASHPTSIARLPRCGRACERHPRPAPA